VLAGYRLLLRVLGFCCVAVSLFLGCLDGWFVELVKGLVKGCCEVGGGLFLLAGKFGML